MTKKNLAKFLLPLLLTACTGGKHTIVELSSRVEVQKQAPISLPINKSINFSLLSNSKNYKISSQKIEAFLVSEDEKLVYFLDAAAEIYCFSLQDKKILWQSALNNIPRDRFFGGGLAIHNDKLFVTYGSRYLVLVDTDSGVEVTRISLPDIVKTKPIISDDNVVVQTVGNQIFALSTKTLNNVWNSETVNNPLSSFYHPEPIKYKDLLIVFYNSGQIFAINSTTGEKTWVVDLVDPFAEIITPDYEPDTLSCPPILSSNSLYIASTTGYIVKINPKTGNIIWKTKAENIQSMSLLGDNIIIVNNAQQLACIKTESGQVAFQTNLYDKPISKAKLNVFLPAVLTNSAKSLDLISNDALLYRFNVDNESISNNYQTYKIPRDINSYFQTKDGSIYFLTNTSLIYAK